MAKVITDLDDFVDYLNTLYEGDDSAPSSGDEDYTVWTSLANIAINLWEAEEGVLWKELFVENADGDGDTETVASTNSYDLPSDFIFPASGFVWLGTGSNKTVYEVIDYDEVQLHENDTGHWCYFDIPNLTLEINPNVSITGGYTINYRYYKNASKVSSGSDTFEMSDPMFAVYYALSELKKEEGDTSAGAVATQKLEGMKTKNEMTPKFQSDNLMNKTEHGFGV